MIQVWQPRAEHRDQRPFGRAMLISELEAHGLVFQRVELPTQGATCLVFATLEAGPVLQLSGDVRTMPCSPRRARRRSPRKRRCRVINKLPSPGP